MTDLIERFRAWIDSHEDGLFDAGDRAEILRVYQKQADEIERLMDEDSKWWLAAESQRKEIERLRAAISDIGFALSGLTVEYEIALEIVREALKDE